MLGLQNTSISKDKAKHPEREVSIKCQKSLVLFSDLYFYLRP
jgi:hypothetical protein